jgi:Skp family chaperone for outer membrane proteins
MGVWQRVAMDSLKYCLGPPCLTLLCPAGRPANNGAIWQYNCQKGFQLAERWRVGKKNMNKKKQKRERKSQEKKEKGKGKKKGFQSSENFSQRFFA